MNQTTTKNPIAEAAADAFNSTFHKCRAEVSMDWWQRIWGKAVAWAHSNPRATATAKELRSDSLGAWTEEQRQLVGEALTNKLDEMTGDDDEAPDWFDARNVDEVLDVIEMALRPSGMPPGFIKPDNEREVFFYEQDCYVLSNFSAFTLMWKGIRFDTSEAAYHWEKFVDCDTEVQDMILAAPSAHEAFKIAESQRALRRSDWDEVKVGVMREILRAKAAQHEYVRRKLLATGERLLTEDSWRDDFWGWGPNRDGQNMLGKLWMEVRAELRASANGGAS